MYSTRDVVVQFCMDFQLGKKLFETLYSGINGYTISSEARSKIARVDKAYTYGEVVAESFYQMIHRMSPKKGEVFYDLGSGTGKAIILASLFFEFSKCIGIEILEDLHKISKELLARFHHETASVLTKDPSIVDFVNADFLQYDFTDGDIFFIHATCFPDELMDKLTKKLRLLKKGARIIMVTKTLESASFREIDHSDEEMGWGKATIYFYEKTLSL